jgi:hypothetical protein
MEFKVLGKPIGEMGFRGSSLLTSEDLQTLNQERQISRVSNTKL